MSSQSMGKLAMVRARFNTENLRSSLKAGAVKEDRSGIARNMYRDGLVMSMCIFILAYTRTMIAPNNNTAQQC